MHRIIGLLDDLKQHKKLTIKVSSQDSPPLPEKVLRKLLKPHKSPYYFLVFVESGSSTHKVDLEEQTIDDGQLLFILPNQIHTPSHKKESIEFFKMSFDQNCLSLLPKPFPFLINPLNSQVISFSVTTRQRVIQLFQTLNQLLKQDSSQKDVEIILAHLNTLMTELNSAYFKLHEKSNLLNGKIQKYIDFKIIIETNLTEQHSIATIAEKLAVSTNKLYNIVKEFSGVSPKEFIINRLMLEAQRKLYYSKLSTKEVAYELGFNDPNYFSRLFRKHTGKNITEYLAEFQDL